MIFKKYIKLGKAQKVFKKYYFNLKNNDIVFSGKE